MATAVVDNQLVVTEALTVEPLHVVDVTSERDLEIINSTSQELIARFPELSLYPELPQEMQVEYLLNGEIATQPVITRHILRYSQYEKLDPLVRQLVNSLYGDGEDYALTDQVSPLEPYILNLDQFMGNDLQILTIGQRMGLGVVDNGEDPTLQFIDKIKLVIIYIVMYQIPDEEVNKVINQTWGEFKQLNVNGTREQYMNRLISMVKA